MPIKRLQLSLMKHTENNVVYDKRMTQNCVGPFKECMRGKYVSKDHTWDN